MIGSKSRAFVIGIVCIFAVACSDTTVAREPSKGSGAKQQDEAPGARRPARPAFSQRSITVGKKTITVEVADDDFERAHGLMFVESMSEDSGMLFVFETQQTLSFWMRNTLIPLSIAYIDDRGRIVDIQEMIPASDLEVSPKTYPSAKPAKYALEMNKGWFARNAIKVGAVVKL